MRLRESNKLMTFMHANGLTFSSFKIVAFDDCSMWGELSYKGTTWHGYGDLPEDVMLDIVEKILEREDEAEIERR